MTIIPYIKQVDMAITELGVMTTRCQTEVMLYSKKYKFAGKVDLIEKFVCDFKSGQPHPKHKIQISAYRHLVNCNQKEKIKEGLIIYLDGTENNPKIIKEKPEDFGAFLSLLNIYNWRKLNGA